MKTFILLVTSALVWVATTTTTTANADKVQISQLNHGESERTFIDGTQEKSGRTLKKAPKTKKSKSPAKKKAKSDVPSSKPSKQPSGCSSNCYSNSDSPAFVTKLTDDTNYHEIMPLVLNICSGEKISIPVGTSTENNYYIALKNPDSTSGACKNYQLIINCCGGLRDCVMDYTGPIITSGTGILYYAAAEPGATLAITLNGITLTSTPDVQIFFDLPEYDATNFPKCFNSVDGPYNTLPPIFVPFYFGTAP
jgi:hypothetical protein